MNNAISKAFREGLLDLSDKADTTFFNPNYEDEDDLKNILKKTSDGGNLSERQYSWNRNTSRRCQ